MSISVFVVLVLCDGQLLIHYCTYKKCDQLFHFYDVSSSFLLVLVYWFTRFTVYKYLVYSLQLYTNVVG